MDANYTVRNESLHDITVTMEDDKKKTYTIPPNGEAVFKSHALERPEFRVFEPEAKEGEQARMLTSKTASPLDSIAASAVNITYVFDGARLH